MTAVFTQQQSNMIDFVYSIAEERKREVAGSTRVVDIMRII